MEKGLKSCVTTVPGLWLEAKLNVIKPWNSVKRDKTTHPWMINIFFSTGTVYFKDLTWKFTLYMQFGLDSRELSRLPLTVRMQYQNYNDRHMLIMNIISSSRIKKAVWGRHSLPTYSTLRQNKCTRSAVKNLRTRSISHCDSYQGVLSLALGLTSERMQDRYSI